MNKKCQVFTPFEIVNIMLDKVGYVSRLYGKKVIENACGDGNILTEIARRYIEVSLSEGYSLRDIKVGLETDIFGAEIDIVHYSKCIENLDELALKYGIKNVSWNLLNKDILRSKLNLKFDFVIGNPPYVTYRDLDVKTRAFLKNNFNTCINGKFDYCYAFIELSLKSLNDSGKLAYLIPNSIFKNVFAKDVRETILPYLSQIHDYTTKKLFTGKLTSSAIIICDKKNTKKTLTYFDIVNNNEIQIDKESLVGKWIFKDYIESDSRERFRFGDYFNASISVATLLNKAFVISDFELAEDYVHIKNFKIERTLVREASSPRALNNKKNELIIFPYYYTESSVGRYSLEGFRDEFPEGEKYLLQFKEELDNRDSDKNSQWFEYGRTQAISHLNQEKLLMSTIVTGKVKVYKLNKDNIPYSGIYITNKGVLPLKKAKEILESEAFEEYLRTIGINANGSSIRITAKDINNFEFFDHRLINGGK